MWPFASDFSHQRVLSAGVCQSHIPVQDERSSPLGHTSLLSPIQGGHLACSTLAISNSAALSIRAQVSAWMCVFFLLGMCLEERCGCLVTPCRACRGAAHCFQGAAPLSAHLPCPRAAVAPHPASTPNYVFFQRLLPWLLGHPSFGSCSHPHLPALPPFSSHTHLLGAQLDSGLSRWTPRR